VAQSASALDTPLSLRAFSKEDLQSDFRFLKQTLMIWNPLVFADQKELSAFMDAQAAKLRDGMRELDFFRVLAPVVAAARCGHSGIRFAAEFDAYLRAHARYFPLQARFFDSRLFVVNPLGTDGVPAGAEITAINGTTSSEILRTMLDGTTADGHNLTKKYAVINTWFADQLLNLVDSSPRFALDLIDPADGAHRAVTVDGVAKADLEKRLAPQGPAAAPFSCSYDTPTVATLTIRTFPYDAEASAKFFAFLEEAFSSFRAHNVSTLILDVRDNWGGDPWTSSALFAHLITKPAPYFAEGTPYYEALTQALPPADNAFAGKLLVLANGASFSSTGHLCALLRFLGRGTFIGEETGGSFSCTDGSRDFPLRATGLLLHCSTHEFRVAVTGMTAGRGILPDFEIIPTVADLVSGRDAEKAFALTQAGGKE
jgi:hypothetical protein